MGVGRLSLWSGDYRRNSPCVCVCVRVVCVCACVCGMCVCGMCVCGMCVCVWCVCVCDMCVCVCRQYLGTKGCNCEVAQVADHAMFQIA